MTIVDALRDPNVFGGLPAFADLSTWKPWLVFLRSVYGLSLDAEELAIFQRYTNRSAPREGGYAEAVAIVGRQSGKSRIAAMIATFEAIRATEDAGSYALLVAQDERAALRTLFAYASEPFDKSPLLASSVTNRVAGVITLANGVNVSSYPCRPGALRGLRARVAVCDELAFFRTSEGNPIDTEMLRALRPTLATTGGKLIVLSSPYAQTGALWDLHRRHFGKGESETLVWVASAPDMHPTLPADYLARMEADDPEAYRSEVLGEFRAGLSTLFDPEAIQACVIPERHELPPSRAYTYKAFADLSGGSRDHFTLAVGHRDPDSHRIVVDALRGWAPPFNPSGVVAEASTLLKTYRCSNVTCDRYAAEWPREQWRSQGISAHVAELDRSALYLELLPLINQGSIELPDAPRLLRELRGLERRRGTSGKDRVDHRPGSTDDYANSVAGLAYLLASRAKGHIGFGWQRRDVLSVESFGGVRLDRNGFALPPVAENERIIDTSRFNFVTIERRDGNQVSYTYRARPGHELE